MADDPYAEFVKPAEAADPYAEFVKQPTALAAPPAVDPYAEFAPPTATAADPYAEFTGKPASVSGNGVPHGTIAPSENTNAEFNAAVQTVRASSGHHPVSPQEFQDEASTAQALLDYRRSRQLHGGAVGTQEFNLEQLAKEPAAPLNAVATFGAETVNQLAPAAATALGAIGGGIVGGVPGAIAGGIGAGKAMSKAQSELLGMIYTPDEQLRFQRNLEASTREHPQAAKMGGFLGQAPELFSGSTALKGIFTKFGMQAEKLPAKLLSNALTGGIMAGSNAAQQGGSVTDIAKEFTKGAVTMMPLAAIPGAKTILGNVLRGPADATVLATANAIYDKFASNKDIDPKQLFRDIISDIPGFVAANIVGHLAGQAHGMPIDETARRTAQLQASTIPAEQHAAILKLPKANQDAIIQAAQPIKLATSDDVEKVLADALKVQGDRAAIAAENFDQFNPTPDRTGEPPISAGAPTPTESAPNPAAPAPEAVKVPAQAATPPIETGAAPSSTPPPETKIAPVAPSTAGGETPLDRAALTKERKSIAKQQRDILNGKDVLSREDMAEYDRLTARDAELARQLTPDAEAKKSRKQVKDELGKMTAPEIKRADKLNNMGMDELKRIARQAKNADGTTVWDSAAGHSKDDLRKAIAGHFDTWNQIKGITPPDAAAIVSRADRRARFGKGEVTGDENWTKWAGPEHARLVKEGVESGELPEVGSEVYIGDADERPWRVIDHSNDAQPGKPIRADGIKVVVERTEADGTKVRRQVGPGEFEIAKGVDDADAERYLNEVTGANHDVQADNGKPAGVPGEGDATPRAGLDQGAGDAKGVFALEQQTPEEVAAERARVAQADAIAKKQSAPLKGGRVDTTAALPGIGEENLFDKNRSAKPPDTSAKLGANESPANARSVKLPGKSEDRVERSYDGATDKHVYALVEKSGRRTEFDPAEHPDLAAHADRELGAKLDTKNGKAIADALLPGHDITAVGSMADVPAEVRGALPKNEQGGGAQGLYHSPTGRTFIIMDQIRDLRDLMETARHEAEGHGGVQAFLGDKFGAFMDGVVASKDKNKLLWSRIENSYGKENPRNTAGEYLAHLAERPQSDLSTWRRVVGFIRNHLRERFGLDVTDADVKYILQRAREETRAVKGEGTRAMLPLNGEDGKVNAEGKSNEQGLHLLGSTKRSDLLGASEQGREIRPKADTAIDDTSSRLRLEGSDAGAEAGDERAKDAAPELRSIFDNKHVPNAVVRAAVKLQNITKGLRHAVTNFAEKQDLAVTLDALGNAADEVNQGLSHDVHNALLRGIHGTADEKKVPRLSRSGLELPERHQENLALSHLVFSGNDLAALKTMRAKVADYLSRGAGDRPMSLAEKANWRRDGAKHLAALDFAIKHFDKMQDAAAMTRKVLDARNAEMNATGIDQRYHKNFFPKYSDLEGVEGTGVAIEGGGGSMGGGAHNEAMKYPTLVDAWAKGVSQKSVDGIQVLNRYLSDTSGKLAARKFVDVGKTMKAKDGRAIVGEMVMGDDIIKPAGKDANGKPKADDGFTLMRDRPGMQHAPGKLEPQTGYEEVTAGGQKIAMLPGFAKYFQHMEAPSAAETSGAAKGGLELAASAKSVMLVGDVFHAMRVAGYELATGNTVGYRRGEMLGKYSLPEAKRMLDNGEITQALYDYKIQNQHIHDALTRAGVNHVNFADNLRSELTRQVPWLSKLNRFIFDDLQVGAMNQVGVNEMRRVLKAKGVDPARATTAELADAAKFVGKDINTRFGNLGRQSVFRNHTFDDMMRFLFLAPRWNEGLIRSEFGAFVRQPLQLARDAVMGKKLIMPTLMKSQLTAIAGMFVANQLLNLATRGKPTWENEEAGHQWDAFIPTDASAPGLFISPMAISAEISHSMYNAFERTDSWIDAARQLATSRFSAVSKPLGVLILKRDALGRSLRPSEVLGETLRESIPAPISGSAVANLTKEGIGKLTGNDAGTRQTQPGEYLKRAISTMGIKTTTAPSAYQQMSKMAQDFNKARSVKEAPEYFIGPYQDLAKYLRIGNTTEARAALEDLRKEKTDTQIQKHFQGLPQTLFTHAGRAQEQAFIGTLTDKQRDLYRAAISEQRATAQKFFDLLRSTPAAPRVGLQHGQ